MSEVGDVSGHYVSGPASLCRRNLQGVLEVGNRKRYSISHVFSAHRSDFDKVGQLQDELARERAAARPGDDVIEV